MPGQHALLSASAAHRWMHCPPSARLTEDIEDTSSIFAQEGTVAHSLGELELNYQLKNIPKREYTKELRKIQAHELYSAEMPDHVAVYTGYVMERLAEAKSRSKDALVFLEQKLDFSAWVPEGFGTGDTVIISDGVIEIVDLKYGKGVEVSADDNPQMMLYALGAYHEYEWLYDPKSIKMTIVQPRIDNISTFEMPVEDLLKWAEEELKPAADKAWSGEGELQAGDHCRFCKVRSTCKARADYNLTFIESKRDEDNTLKGIHLLAPEEISRVLDMALEIKNWLKDVEENALQAALDGTRYPGFKLVEGRSNRVITDEEEVVATLVMEDYTEDQLYNKKLKGITDLEKLVGKKMFEQLLGPYVIKPPGKPTLVPETDKRPELNTAADDFNLEV
ncbi:DUF2800 domain-containing protein [Proteiniclasticum sp. BAD-10]|uniref:DUF2800 domain-containing protein n=1 Tax=Proteiniclasticum sediminis TaxID=2804028 RepID=A0A941CPJ0_9CLOT|nr:DUF2800 domain-containing protein [Proteiniclasticum sediminis]MBR0575709.1 DUF2800 domain-containing protein [Proteiniclasticum sediminis]